MFDFLGCVLQFFVPGCLFGQIFGAFFALGLLCCILKPIFGKGL